MQKKILQLNSGYRFFIAGTLCFYLAYPSSAFAQNDTTKKLKEVKVTTEPIPKVQSATPAQQINAADFEHYNAFNVADAIRDFSGVILKDYGGIGGLKTVSVRGLSANHTAILYDGIQINDAENGQVDLGKLNLNNIQEITLYNGQPPVICMPARSFAYSSVLSVKTIKPNLAADKPYQITAGLKAGSFGLFNPYLQWQQRISDTWSFVINSYLENANGRYKYKIPDAKDSTGTRTNADIGAQQIDGALYWTKNDSSKFNLHVNYYNSDRGLPGAVTIGFPDASRQRLYNRDFFLQSGYEHIWANRLHLLLNGKFSQNYLRYIDPDFLNAQHLLDQRFTQREFYFSAALSYFINNNWELSYASDVAVNDLNTNLYNFAFPTRLNLLNVLASNYTIGKLRLQGSLLNTNVSETVKSGRAAPTRNNFSPTFIATYQPFASPNLQLRGFYKSIFRNPTFDDLYYGGIGNPNLKPEYTKQIDLGLMYSKALNGVFNYLIVNIDSYYNKVTNKIVFLPKDAYNGSIQNFGKVDIEGIDAGVKTQAKLSGKWKGTLAVNYSFQSALNVTDQTSSIYLNQLPYTPKNTFALNAGIDNGALGIWYNQVIASSRYYTNDNKPYDYLSGYNTADGSVIYRFSLKGKAFIASAGVHNLFNERYVILQSYPMPGRSFQFSIQITI